MPGPIVPSGADLANLATAFGMKLIVDEKALRETNMVNKASFLKGHLIGWISEFGSKKQR